jgi:site-specific DNA-cytosine methylase
MTNILKTNLIADQSKKLKKKKSQAVIYLLEAFLANPLAMLVKEWVLGTPVGHYSLKSLELSTTKNPNIFYLKMLKGYLLMTMDGLSKQYLKFLPTWGISWNGKCLTLASSGYLKTVKESSLSELISGATRTPLRYLKRNQKNIVGDYAFTIDVGNTGGVLVNGIKRKLTNEEKEILQGFPKGWTNGVSESQRNKMLGNAVTVNVVMEVARTLEK